MGNHLHRHGKLWLEFIYPDFIIANKINDVLLLLYRVVNAGYIIYTLLMFRQANNFKEGVEFLATRFSYVVVALAFLHYQNILILFIFSQRKFYKS